LTEHVASLDLPSSRCIGIDAGGIHIRPGLIVRAIPSAHEGLDKDAEGRHLYLGFVIELDGTRFYHSGDSVVYPGLVDELGPERFDVLFLPINGRNPERGVPGNMSAAEAVDLANEVGPRFVVPHHYDMFTFNTVPVATFDAEAKRLRSGVTAKVLRCGERWEVGPWA
jgi:L-ascorbate metabolism protein UlaG (beta-lactamase superfamily)